MYHPRTSIYICMMLDKGGDAMAAEVIQASSLAQAVDRAEELLACATMPRIARGYELWNRGRKLATWQAGVFAA